MGLSKPITQLNSSIQEALKNHPELKKYIVALPFNLTGKTGRKGQSEIEKFEDWKNTWEKDASSRGISLEIILWDEGYLKNLLVQDKNQDLTKYYFGKEILDHNFFKKQVDARIANLGERYSPENHVERDVEKYFDTLIRGGKLQQELKEIINKYDDKSNYSFSNLSNDEYKLFEETDRTNQKIDELFPLDISQEYKIIEAKEFAKKRSEILKNLEQAIEKSQQRKKLEYPQEEASLIGKLPEAIKEKLPSFLQAMTNHYPPAILKEIKELPEEEQSLLEELKKLKHKHENLNYWYNQDQKKISLAQQENDKIQSFLSSKEIKIEQKRVFFLYGKAGVGKSHLLGEAAQKRLESQIPVLLFLGDEFSSDPLNTQFCNILGLMNQPLEQLLALLNAAGERQNTRLTLFIDAINEGKAGIYFWKSQLPAFLKELQKHKYLSVVISCREEYFPYLKSSSMDFPKIQIEGLTSPKEQEQALEQYFHKNGIVPPPEFFLSTELQNPLLLRTIIFSLKAEGRTFFPTGKTGISTILNLYQEALSNNFCRVNVLDDCAKRSFKKLMLSVAKNMAETGEDFLLESEMEALSTENFSAITPPPGKNWKDLLLGSHLFRKDLSYEVQFKLYKDEEIDPLAPPPDEEVRFSFQLFSDYLIAKELMNKISEPFEKLFNKDGVLFFLRYPQHDPEISKYQPFLQYYRYNGTISALSTLFPEEFSREFIDILPQKKLTNRDDRELESSFIHSVKYRKEEAFSNRTLELLKWLNKYGLFNLLIDISLIPAHPYNAEFLHRNLKRMSLSDRDSCWTQHINQNYLSLSEDDNSKTILNRLIDLALKIESYAFTPTQLQLISLLLCWCLTSSNRSLRDNATKGLVACFKYDLKLFSYLLEKFGDVNDPYVLERLYGAAYGSACLDPTKKRLTNYSSLVFKYFFSQERVLLSIKTRDSAMRLIDLAKDKDALGNDVILNKCRYPFKSEKPDFSVTEDELKDLVKRLCNCTCPLDKDKYEHCCDYYNADRIFHSANSEWTGDFAKYIIPHHVNNFLTIPLTENKSKTFEEIKQNFYDEVLLPFPERKRLLDAYDDIPPFSVALLSDKELKKLITPQGEPEVALKVTQQEKRSELKSNLISLLSPNEAKRLEAEYFTRQSDNFRSSKIDVIDCCRWVVKRAYDLGWTPENFPNDKGSAIGREHAPVERIGKKYQWIALDELQARLADNYYFLSTNNDGWETIPSIYPYHYDNLNRHIDLTILPNDKWIKSPETPNFLPKRTENFPDFSEKNAKEWVASETIKENLAEELFRQTRDGKKFLILASFKTQNNELPHKGSYRAPMEECFISRCILIPKGKRKDFLKEENGLSTGDFNPPSQMYQYLYETYLREGDSSLQERHGNVIFQRPLVNFSWERDRDLSLPDGVNLHIPSAFLRDGLNLKPSSNIPLAWENDKGDIICQYQAGNEDDHTKSREEIFGINEDVFFAYCHAQKLEPVWIFFKERTFSEEKQRERIMQKGLRKAIQGTIWKAKKNWKENIHIEEDPYPLGNL